MTAEILNKSALYTPAQAAGLLSERVGRRVAPSTVIRWILRGLQAPDGTRVRLAATRIGSRWYVDEPALEEFLRRMGLPADSHLVPDPRSQSRRKADAEAAVAELEARGG
jgi:hypothetical protein